MASYIWPAQGNAGASPGDLVETTFSAANNQSTPADVTGLIFGNSVRSFQAIVSVSISASTPLDESFTLNGIQNSGSWSMSGVATGDDSGFYFTVGSGGQLQYVSANYPGFTSATVKFRAITTSV